MLERAVRRAQSGRPLPSEWVKRASKVAEGPSKTFTVALGTALLARATHPRIDPLALKESSGRRAYSARTLAHNVLVPAASEFRFDLRTTGREPLNNQPFFRYDRIDRMERVHTRARESHRYLVTCLRKIERLSQAQAKAALAAFLRDRLEAAEAIQAVELEAVSLGLRELIGQTENFVTNDPEEGKRGQALVAAAFELAFKAVQTRRVYDPSRRFPGDVQALEGAKVVLACEVRQKPVTASEAVQFAARLERGGVAKGLIVALHPDQEPLPRAELFDRAEEDHGIMLSIIEGTEELVTSTVWVASTSTFSALDKWTLASGDVPVLLSIETLRDEDGVTHSKLGFGS